MALGILLDRKRGRVDLDDERIDGLDAPARPIVHEIVLGVRRHVFLLDAVLRGFVKERIGSMRPHLIETLRMGVHDLLFRDRVPAPVVVGESVDLAGRSQKDRGFVNAVLRRVSESFTIAPDDGGPPERERVWTAPGRVARFAKPVLPDPEAHLAKHHATLYTLTESFAREILELLPLEHEDFFRASSVRLPLMLRPTCKAGSPAALRERVAAGGGTVLAEAAGLLAIESEGRPAALEVLRDGFALVQDLTAAEVVPFLDVRPGQRALDLCAPPGGKTAQIAEALGDSGTVVAAHAGPDRARRLQENVTRLGLANVRLHDLGPKGAVLPAGPFDRILVDAPCSNTAVLMKRVEARFRVHPREVEQLAALQLRLLRRAAHRLGSGGVLVYSTCSVLPAENEDVVRAILKAEKGLVLDEERLRWPQRTGRDGGYMARLRRA